MTVRKIHEASSWLLYPLAGLAFVLLVLALTILYRLFLHPLSRVPGPKLAAISNAWQAWHLKEGHMFLLGKELHRKYGPVVRVGPNELCFNSKEAVKTIYGSPCFWLDRRALTLAVATALQKPRPDWRLRMEFADTLDLLAETDMKRYRRQRRLIGPVYQTSSLKRHEHAIDAVLDRFVAALRELRGREVDLKEWMHVLVVECLGAVVLTASPGYLRDRTDWASSAHSYLGWKRKTVFGLFPTAVALSNAYKPFGRWFSNLWGLTYVSPAHLKAFFPFVQRKAHSRINAATRPRPPKDPRQDLLADLIQLHKERPEFSEIYLRRLALTNFGAGHETTTSAMTSALAMIGSHADVQRRVHAELRSRAPAEAARYDTAARLEYTQASIKEAQRLFPVIGMSLPRRAPDGGFTTHGIYVPGGTTVGCNPVALHRNPDIFGHDADAYRPDRWLAADGHARTMDRYSLTWGGGARTCPGRHLAELIVCKAVPALLREFDVVARLPEERDITYYFMAMLTGVKVSFSQRHGVADEATATSPDEAVA